MKWFQRKSIRKIWFRVKRATGERLWRYASDVVPPVWLRISAILALMVVATGFHPNFAACQEQPAHPAGNARATAGHGRTSIGKTLERISRDSRLNRDSRMDQIGETLETPSTAPLPLQTFAPDCDDACVTDGVGPSDQSAEVDPAVLQEILAIRRQLGSVVEGLGQKDGDEQFQSVLKDVIRDAGQRSAKRTRPGFDAPRTETVGPAYAAKPISGRFERPAGYGQGLAGNRSHGVSHLTNPMENRTKSPYWRAARPAADEPARRVGTGVERLPAGAVPAQRLRDVAVNLEHLAAELEALGRYGDADQVRRIAGGVRSDSRRARPEPEKPHR